MIVRLATLSTVLLHGIVRIVARIPPSLWLKFAVIIVLIAIKQGVLP